MSPTSFRIALNFLGRWLVIAALVAFLTFTFSFLGTILCAVVIGMMMGGTKHARWQTVPVALLFPIAVFVMLRSSDTELLRRQINGVSLLCFGAFWLTYAMTTMVMVVEKKGVKAPARCAAAESICPTTDGLQVAATIPMGGAKDQVVELSLAILQGLWDRERKGSGTEPRSRLEITQDHLVIKGLDTEGHVRWVAEGDLKLEHDGTAQRVVLLPATHSGAPIASR